MIDADTTLPKRDTIDKRIVFEVKNGIATFEGEVYKFEVGSLFEFFDKRINFLQQYCCNFFVVNFFTTDFLQQIYLIL